MPLPEKFEIILPPPDIQSYPGFLVQVSGGDEKAFQWLYKNYSRKIFDYAFLVTQHKQLSEDIVQDVFLKLWSERTRLKNIENFNGWFYTIGRNCTLDKLKAKQRERHYLDEFAERNPQSFIGDEGIIHKENVQVLHDAVKTLSPQQQLAYVLKNHLSWKREKIASALNVSPHTVKQQLQRAVKAIRIYFLKRIKD